MRKNLKRALAMLLAVLMLGAGTTCGAVFASDAEDTLQTEFVQTEDMPLTSAEDESENTLLDRIKDRVADALWVVIGPIVEPIVKAIANGIAEAMAPVFAAIVEGFASAIINGIVEAILSGITGRQSTGVPSASPA